MTFLESAALLIPALTGVAITIDSGGLDTLNDFEQQYCFSPQLQNFYTAAGLALFFESHTDGTVYEVQEPLGSWSLAFQVRKQRVLIGPYVEDGWNERSAARSLLAELGASEAMYAPYKTYRCKLPIARREYVLKTAMLVAQHESGLSSLPTVKAIYAQAEQFYSAPSFLGAYEEVQVIQRRYATEDRFILAISQEYAQRMQHTTTARELSYLMVKLVEELCKQVRVLQKNKRSLPVRRAIEYMTANLSDPMTIADIARVAGVERHKLTRDFQQEVGMTIKQYLRQTRCGLAADLLADSQAGVQEIAAYVGYPDGNYFTKVFKACRGMTPQEWRMLHGRPELVEAAKQK